MTMMFISRDLDDLEHALQTCHMVHWVFRKSVTGVFGIVTGGFGNVTGHFGDVTDGSVIGFLSDA